MLSFIQYLTEADASNKEILSLIDLHTKRNDPTLLLNDKVGISNELFCAYLLNYRSWKGIETVKQELINTLKSMGKFQATDSFECGKVMSYEFLKAVRSMEYGGGIKEVIHSGRVSPTIDGIKINPQNNPSDIICRFGYGPANGWCGISNKITVSKHAQVAYKNPGLSVLTDLFGINVDYSRIVDKYKKLVINKFNLKHPDDITTIKNNRNLYPISQECLNNVNELFYRAINSVIKNTAKIRTIIAEYFMNTKVDLFPPYLKVTGRILGKGRYVAEVENPIKSKKYLSLFEGKFSIKKNENSPSILFFVNNNKICKLRFKWHGAPFITRLKTSVE